MPRASREVADATARRILDTGSALFAAHGYADVALAAVAAHAGVTRGAVYHHYASKQALFAAVVSAAHERVAAAVVAAADRASDPWEGLVAGCHAFLDVSTDPSTRRILLIDAPAVLGWQVWRELDATHSERHLTDALEDLERSGTIATGSTRAASIMLSGAMNAAALAVAADVTAAPEYHAFLDRLLSALRVDLTSARAR